MTGVKEHSTNNKGKTKIKRKNTLADDLKTVEEVDRKSKSREGNKNSKVQSIYTSYSKIKASSSGTIGVSKSKTLSNSKTLTPGNSKPRNSKTVEASCYKIKKKVPSKNNKSVSPDSKCMKKDFLKNEDEEGESINGIGKETADCSIEGLSEMTKTCYITTDAEKDVRKKFCETLLASKTIKAVVSNNEFKNPKYKPKDLPATAFAKNVSLNRYNDVKCIDKTRIKLKRNIPGLKVKKASKTSSIEDKGNFNDSDYIHANYVNVPNSDFKYICCQGPMENTLDDHWLMCWQENVKVIVMLCELEEDNCEKCHKYWPDLMTKKAYGGIVVSNEKEDFNKYPNVVIRTFRIQLGDKKRTIIQYHMKSWPDRLIPTGTPIICCMLREVQLVSGLNPIVVHCSAGIGRTGTFIGIHYVSEKFKVSQDGSINVMEVIREMREQRLQSVQSTIQFGYLHICLLQYFCEENIFELSDEVKKFIEKSVKLVHEYALRLAKKNKEKENEIKDK